MVATATQAQQLLNKLCNDFKAYTFKESGNFVWSSPTKCVHHPVIRSQEDIWSLLHEIAHAELNHHIYGLDIELLQQEVAAWQLATHLAPRYDLLIDCDYIEEHLDTYRQWLHRRSLCPDCQQNGFQTTQNTYSCSNCRCLWRVNDARLCGLQRVRLPNQNRSL